jgi:hypothetical protein
MAIIIETIVAGTLSSTIRTLFKVPINITSAIPTETWNNDNLNNLGRGTSGVAASANGKNLGPNDAHDRINDLLISPIYAKHFHIICIKNIA